MTARGRVRFEPGAKRVRVRFADVWIADTTAPLLVWEKPYYPTYYLPVDDVRTDLLVDTGEVRRSPSRGTGRVLDLVVDGHRADAAALIYDDPEIPALGGHVRLDWPAMDAWFEEDEEVFVHPRDPYTRIDVLPSSRHVRVEIDGVTVADSTAPVVLFETNLPPRFYLPREDVRSDLLRASDTHTDCPYKGTASYCDVVLDSGVHEDAVWWYPDPVPESARIAGYLCFYNERVDLFVDGERLERPRSPFSPRSAARAAEAADGPA